MALTFYQREDLIRAVQDVLREEGVAQQRRSEHREDELRSIARKVVTKAVLNDYAVEQLR